ncbi:MAG: DUF4445 domain-containing protein, partial [Alistipes sp.]|nr:DUF4445 domain-containing protein [Alistipes sp.]
RIGLVPRELAKKARAVGNSALAGASMLMLCPEYRDKARKLASLATTLDLSTHATFLDKDVEGMMLEEL